MKHIFTRITLLALGVILSTLADTIVCQQNNQINIETLFSNGIQNKNENMDEVAGEKLKSFLSHW